MADAPVFESPIVKTYVSTPSTGGLSLRDESSLAKVVVRADDDTTAASQLGVVYGSTRSAVNVQICGQRPTEWLLVGDAEAVTSFVDTLDQTGHVSLIDHTHSRALFRLTGDDSARLLEKVCSLDWSDDMTPDGSAVSASVAKVNCDITRDDVDHVSSYRIACDRSFAQYLFDALLDAGTEFGASVER